MLSMLRYLFGWIVNLCASDVGHETFSLDRLHFVSRLLLVAHFLCKDKEAMPQVY